MWGQSMNTKVLLDSLLAEKVDGTIVAGRGVPFSWNADGEEVVISNFLCENGKRIGFTMKTQGNVITFTLTGDKLEMSDVSLELPVMKDNIKSASGNCEVDSESGKVTIPAGVREVTVTLSK